MRASLLIVSIGLIVLAAICFALRPHARSSSAFTSIPFGPNVKPDFDTDIKPILQTRCQPCHFQGGQVYEKLPFDKPATIAKLGTRLFTRIKDEKERRLIQEFLDASNSDARNR